MELEVRIPEMQTTVFIVPGEFVKNGDERMVVLTGWRSPWWRHSVANIRRTCLPIGAGPYGGC